MVRFRGDSGDGLQRLVNKKRTRVTGRFRAKKKGHTLTSVQKAQLQLERQDRAVALNKALRDAREAVWDAAKKMHAEFQTHSTEYFFHLIMQTSRITTAKRRTSRWNAYLSQELQRRNADLPEGKQRKHVSDGELTREIAAQWKALSEEEQIAATEETLKALEERHEDHKKGTHTVPIQAFHDARATVDTIKRELQDLNARTGIEAVLFVTRSTTSSYVQPFAFATNNRLPQFVLTATKSTMTEFALKMEGFCLSGMQGIAHNYTQGLLNLKKEAAVLINTKLQEACPPDVQISRMCYVNFDTRITQRLGIIIENWPLKKFCAPGEICSRPELDVLIQSWKSDATRFRMMAPDEWEEWKTKRLTDGSGGSEDPKDGHTDGNVGGAVGDGGAVGNRGSGDGAAGVGAGAVNGGDAAVNLSINTPDATVTAHEVHTASSPHAAATAAASTTTHAVAAAVPFTVSSPPPAASLPSEAASVPNRKRTRKEISFVAVDVVTGPDGRSVAVAKRSRKTQSKKGAAEGPSTSATPAASENGVVKQTRKRKSKKTKADKVAASSQSAAAAAAASSTSASAAAAA